MSHPHPRVAAGATAVAPLQWGVVPAETPWRAVASALLVFGIAAVVQYRWRGVTDRAVEAALEQPLRTPLYGVGASALGWLVVAYAFGQASRLGGVVGRAAVALGFGGALVVGGFGFVVVGTAVTRVLGDRRPWVGALAGTGLSALVLVALPPRPGLVVWVLVAATGLGGVARRWLHASQSVERRQAE